MVLQLPVPKDVGDIGDPITVKVIEEDYYRKYKPDNGIKSLLRAYDETRKKNSSECMTRIGLDIIKIKSFSKNNDNDMSSKDTKGNSFPTPAIHSKKSLRRLELIQNGDVLLPLKSGRVEGKQVKANKSGRYGDNDNKGLELAEMISSVTSFSVEREVDREKQMKVVLASQKPEYKRETKAGDYLYKRLEGTEKAAREEQNQIYDKRIRSFLEFIWKNMFAHSVYGSLDIRGEDLGTRPRKLKAYVALGNNGAMVRGLIKRRFWWSLVEERTPDC